MRTRLKLATVAGAAIALAGAALGASASAATSGNAAPPSNRHGPALDHIFVIMLENHSQSSVIDDPNAPFITSLAHTYSMADDYYGVTHPSMPNYLAAVAGDNFGIQDDNDQNVVNLDRPNVAEELSAAGIRWGAYLQDLPADKLARFGPSSAEPLYAKKHNPFVLFDGIKNNPAELANVKDYNQLGTDLNSPNAPQFVWITPNQCNDMHGGVGTVPGHPETPCPYSSAKNDTYDRRLKANADAFVHQAVDTIMGSKAWTKRSAIFIVTDENDYTGNAETGGWESAAGCCDSPYVAANDPRLAVNSTTPSTWPGGTYGGGLIPAIVVSASGPRGYVDHTPYNHYSMLTTIEQNWGLPYTGHAGDTAGGVVGMWPMVNGR